jgi:hypothetical protein
LDFRFRRAILDSDFRLAIVDLQLSLCAFAPSRLCLKLPQTTLYQNFLFFIKIFLLRLCSSASLRETSGKRHFKDFYFLLKNFPSAPLLLTAFA